MFETIETIQPIDLKLIAVSLREKIPVTLGLEMTDIKTVRSRITSTLISGSALAVPFTIPALLILTLEAAQADQTVTSGTVATQIILANGETLTIEEGGRVTDVADHAVLGAALATININNAGRIGSGINGISAPHNIGNLINSGTIYGSNAGTLTGGSVSNIYNSGTIYGAGNYGILVIDALTQLTNTGTISGVTHGVVANTVITDLFNSGTISGGNVGVIASDLITNIVNSGTIIGTNDVGIFSRGSATTLINSGTISGGTGVDLGQTAIATDRAIITNSGTIEGTGGIAIYLQGIGVDTLNLEAGSILIGTVDMVGANDTINFGKGLSAVVNLGGTEPSSTNFTSPVNYSDASTRVQGDISTLGAMGHVLEDVAGGITSAVRTRLDTVSLSDNLESNNGAGFGYGTRETIGTFGGSYWGSVWGSTSHIGSSSFTAATTHATAGSLLGADWIDDSGDLYGVFGGAGLGNIQVDVKRGQKTDTQNFYGGAYSKRQIGEGIFDFNLLGGWINFNSERYVDTETALANYKGWFIAPTIGYNRPITLGNQHLLASTSVGYSGLFLDGYSESGSSSNLTVGSRAIHQLNARGELSWFKEGKITSDRSFNYMPFIGLDARYGIGGNDATVSMLGNTVTFNPGGDAVLTRAFVGTKLNMAINENASVFGRIEASYDTTNTSQLNGQIGFAVKF